MKHSVIILFVIALAVNAVNADVINVPTDQATIQAGINAATNGDTVLVADGTYLENIDFKGKAITVASHFIMQGDTSHISNTIIDGSQPSSANKGSVVSFVSGEDTTSVLTGFTITGGTGSYWATWDFQIGGGIWIEGGAKITHNHIVNNSVQHGSRIPTGGGIGIQTGYPTVLPNGHVIIQHNRIAQNSCSGVKGVAGGGIAVYGYGRTRIASNTITQNKVSAGSLFDWVPSGGGVCIWEATPDIIKNIISENEAPFGGGIAAVSDIIYGFSLQLINNTIVDNTASEKGGGIYLYGGYCNAMNNIFWGNTATDDPDIFYRGNLDVNYSITQGDFSGFGTGNSQSDPLFANSAYHLSDNSPAIDGGSPDPSFNDPEDSNNLGQPLWPAKGTLRADIGGFGGNDTMTMEPEPFPVVENFLYRQFGPMHYRFAYPLNYDSTVSYPLTVALHGGPQWGTDNQQQLFVGIPWRVNAEYFGYNEFTIVPQAPNATGWHSDSNLQTVYHIIRNTIANYPVDTTQIVITGVSRGGGGTWRILALYPQLFSAAVPVSGYDKGFGDIKHVPVWVHHGTRDANISVGASRNYIARFEATGLTALYPEKMSGSQIQAAIDNHARLFYSEYVGAEHWVYLHSFDNYFMFEWLKRQRRPVIRPINSSTNETFYQPGVDSIRFTTRFSNPHSLSFGSQVIVENFDKVKLDTLPLFDDGLHGDSLAQDGIWGNILPLFQAEEKFRLGVKVDNTALGDTFYFHDLAAFTTIGPITFSNYEFRSEPNPGERITLRIALQNNGLNATATNLAAQISSQDSFVTIPVAKRSFNDIAPGETATSDFFIVISEDCPAGEIPFNIDISSNDYPFWSDTFLIDVKLPTKVADINDNIPTEFALDQNYPNPFNPKTVISYQLPQQSLVELVIYNIAGQKVATLVSEKQPAGTYNVEWIATAFASGVYLYKITAGGFEQVKKLLLLK